MINGSGGRVVLEGLDKRRHRFHAQVTERRRWETVEKRPINGNLTGLRHLVAPKIDKLANAQLGPFLVGELRYVFFRLLFPGDQFLQMGHEVFCTSRMLALRRNLGHQP